jgi:hypothetical protein
VLGNQFESSLHDPSLASGRRLDAALSADRLGVGWLALPVLHLRGRVCDTNGSTCAQSERVKRRLTDSAAQGSVTLLC